MAHHSRVAGVLVSASTLCLAHVGLALDVTVTTNSDVVDDTDGVVSLREAVADTNALTGPDTITFAAALSGQRIVLGSGPLEVADDLVIQGPGSSLLTVSNGNTNSGRVFWVQDGERTSQRSVTIVGLTIADGVSRDFDLGGAGIYNEEHLSLIDCRVTNNFDWMARGGGIRNAGTLSLSGCAIDHNQANVAGGGIYNSQGLLLVSDSTIADNVSVSLEGGGIYNLDGEVFIDRSTITDNAVNTSAQGGGLKNAGGDVTVTNSTFEGNTATSASTSYGIGGAIYNDGTFLLVASTISNNEGVPLFDYEQIYGGGIANFGDFTMLNSTVSGNRARDSYNPVVSLNAVAYAGGIYNEGSFYAANCTIANNSADTDAGGVFSYSGTFELANTIVANNEGNTYDDTYGSFTIVGCNLVEDGSVAGSCVYNEDPLLGTLANNGGPTRTHALLDGSPAIGAGSSSHIPPDSADMDGDLDTSESSPFDQRGVGFDRIVNATVDLGAVEYTHLPGCGDGNVDAGEDCDLGVDNGRVDGCCTSNCRFQTSGTTCRPSLGGCDVAETCTGVGAECPTDAFEPTEATCGDATATTCTSPDTCDGNGTCLANHASTTTECRPSAGGCDVAEYCDGAGSCPADAVLASGSVCRASAGGCDAEESCDGSTAQCPEDAAVSDGAACLGDCSTGDECPARICVGGDCVDVADVPDPEPQPGEAGAGGTENAAEGGNGGEPGEPTGGVPTISTGGVVASSNGGASTAPLGGTSTSAGGSAPAEPSGGSSAVLAVGGAPDATDGSASLAGAGFSSATPGTSAESGKGGSMGDAAGSSAVLAGAEAAAGAESAAGSAGEYSLAGTSADPNGTGFAGSPGANPDHAADAGRALGEAAGGGGRIDGSGSEDGDGNQSGGCGCRTVRDAPRDDLLCSYTAIMALALLIGRRGRASRARTSTLSSRRWE